jgi:predicted ATP-grasp superfamily ATP-dependent carboligase
LRPAGVAGRTISSVRTSGALDALVLDLDTRAGLAIARNLGRGGYALSVAARDGRASGLRTRYAVRGSVLPDPELDFEAYAGSLVDLLGEHSTGVVIPAIDSSVEALHRHRDAIGRLAAPALGTIEAVEVALSKVRTLEVARDLGLPAPRSLLVSSAGDLDAAVLEIGVPCVLKPTTSWRSLGAGGERVAPVYAADAVEARRLGSDLIRPGAPVLVQELAGGTRETIKLFRHRGRTLVRLAMLVDRTWPPLGGSSVMRRTASPPEDTLELAERLVAAIGLEGYSEVEFRRDGSGRPLLMEVNPRLSQSVELATRAGIDFPRMQLEWARGGSIPQPAGPILGLRVGWLAGDLRLLVGALAGSPPPRPRFGPTLASVASDYLVHRARIEGLDLSDRRPVVGALAFAVRGLARRKSL